VRNVRTIRATRTFFVSLAAFFGFSIATVQAAPRDIEIDLRDSTYLFGVPDGSLGPFHSEKLDAVDANSLDTLFLHAVVTNRLDVNGATHGEFVRIEDDRRFGATTVRAAAGVGGGVLGERSATVAAAEALVPNRRLALSGAVDITDLSAHEEQRVVGAGPEFAVGGVAVFARYYRASVTNGTSAPSSACILANAALSRRAGLSLAANFGGEVNADRTSGFLPTSSGRFGTEISLAGRLALGMRAAVLVAYDGAVYRGAPGGALARVQHIITVGLGTRPFGP
jgi:hypothetical protein